MRKQKISIKDLKSQISSLQDKLEREEQKLNCEIGAWVRQQTNVDSLQDFQLNFIISAQKNKSEIGKDGDKIPQILPLKTLSNEEKFEDEQLNF